MMRRTRLAILFTLALSLSIIGCNTAFMVGDRVVGVQSGKFFYTDGVLKTDYSVPFETAWTACEKTLADLKATTVQIEKKLSKGTFDAVLEGEDLRISIEYIESKVTMVAVRVGLTGNNVASKLIHDRIRANLSDT